MSSTPLVGFKSLKTLSLKGVKGDDVAIQYFLSECPLLERLFLHQNHDFRILKVIGMSLMLRYLEVVTCWGIETIEMCNTNLVSFTYVGGYSTWMVIKNTPQLVEVSITPSEMA